MLLGELELGLLIAQELLLAQMQCTGVSKRQVATPVRYGRRPGDCRPLTAQVHVLGSR